MVVVGVGEDVELAEPFPPLLGSLCGGWVSEEKCDVDEACRKDGLCSFDVLCLVD